MISRYDLICDGDDSSCCTGITYISDGEYVLYSDHAAIVAEHEAVEMDLADAVLSARGFYDHTPKMREEVIAEARRRNEVKVK